MKNKYGLSRSIPSEVKRQIRQRSKFGCVICRTAIYTYEHINPTFINAREHNPDHMCILCNNCQVDSTNGVLSKKKIRDAYNKIQESENVDDPKRKGFFDVYERNLTVNLGKSSFQMFHSVINIDGKDYLSFKPDPDRALSYVINGLFLDHGGSELFRIENNEWIGNTRQWDVDLSSTNLTIRRSKGNIMFSASKDPVSQSISIMHLNMWAPPFHILIEKGNLLVGRCDIKRKKMIYFFISGEFKYGTCALYLDSMCRLDSDFTAELEISGGDGAYIRGTGICIGRSFSSANISAIGVYPSDENFLSNELNIEGSTQAKRNGQQIFILGCLETRLVKFPDWEEVEYYLYGYKLKYKPASWGVVSVDDKSGRVIELFHIDGGVKAQLEDAEGFIGYWADDFVNEHWAKNVFECYVWEYTEDGKHRVRVKIKDISDREIAEEINPETGQWFHPHEFAGVPVWKGKKRIFN
ncbi:MAG: hypothetical protein JNK24_07195 [Alphaproteobacteria bacterium]|nr:hypothetical protein [Alphaproteobacteria bacterium]